MEDVILYGKEGTEQNSLNSLNEKMDELLKEFRTVTILNGDDGKTPTTMSRQDFNQMLYNRTSFKHRMNNISQWSSKVIPIGVIAIFLISILLLWLGQKELAQQLQQIKVR